MSPVRDESPARDQDLRTGEAEEEVELEGESIDTETGEPRTNLAEPVETAPAAPAGSPEIASAVDFSATDDSVALRRLSRPQKRDQFRLRIRVQGS